MDKQLENIMSLAPPIGQAQTQLHKSTRLHDDHCNGQFSSEYEWEALEKSDTRTSRGWMPFLSSNQQCQSTGHNHGKSPSGLIHSSTTSQEKVRRYVCVSSPTPVSSNIALGGKCNAKWQKQPSNLPYHQSWCPLNDLTDSLIKPPYNY